MRALIPTETRSVEILAALFWLFWASILFLRGDLLGYLADSADYTGYYIYQVMDSLASEYVWTIWLTVLGVGHIGGILLRQKGVLLRVSCITCSFILWIYLFSLALLSSPLTMFAPASAIMVVGMGWTFLVQGFSYSQITG